MARSILVLWRWSEAQRLEGYSRITHSVGGQMKAIAKGDRLFVCATSGGELYLLGLLEVSRDSRKENYAPARKKFGSHRAPCRNVGGPFMIAPLGERKWQLRFINTASERLKRGVTLALQLR